MIIGVHQPQYLPWLPYFLKIDESDVFVILDTVDFQKNGIQNRNKIKNSQGASWLTVPVFHRLGQKIIDITIDNNGPWRRKHWQTIKNNYQKTVGFKKYGEELESVYMKSWDKLQDLNLEIILMMMRWMNIQTSLVKSSSLQVGGVSSELVLNICLELEGTHYLSGIGGLDYLNENEFKRAGIHILYREPVLPLEYPQLFPKAGYLSDLSALDVLFNCGNAWRKFLPK